MLHSVRNRCSQKEKFAGPGGPRNVILSHRDISVSDARRNGQGPVRPDETQMRIVERPEILGWLNGILSVHSVFNDSGFIIVLRELDPSSIVRQPEVMRISATAGVSAGPLPVSGPIETCCLPRTGPNGLR